MDRVRAFQSRLIELSFFSIFVHFACDIYFCRKGEQEISCKIFVVLHQNSKAQGQGYRWTERIKKKRVAPVTSVKRATTWAHGCS